MKTPVTKIIALLNDFSMIDEILDKTFNFAQKYNAIVEILYVHESPFFEIPDFFHSDENKMIVDKEKIKVAILEKVATFNVESSPIVFVKIDDTPNRVWTLVREDTETLIICAYHKDITPTLAHKITQPILVLKQNTKKYQKIALIIDSGNQSSNCIEKAKSYFSNITIELFYDYKYIVVPSIEASLQNIQIIEDAQKEAFETLKKEKGLDGKFFIDGDFSGTQLDEYLQKKDYDMLYICSYENDFFVSNTLATTLMDTLNCDIFIGNT